MTGVTEASGSSTARSDQSTTEQAKEKVQETAQQVQEKAVELKGQTGNRLRSEIDNRTTQAGSQLTTTASAMRRTGEKLREEGSDSEAKIVNAVAERAERLGGYMNDVDADRLLRDVENFGRRQPWLLAFGGAALGFFASRFMKASSSQRYEGGSNQSRSMSQGRSSSGYGALSAADLDAPSTREAQGAPVGMIAESGGSPSGAAAGTTGRQRGGSSGNSQ
jgi:hypothetical protein